MASVGRVDSEVLQNYSKWHVLKNDRSVILDFSECRLSEAFRLVPSLRIIDLGS